ncbi:MAG: hypothetical protein RLO01_01085 [Thalassobaculaceae bacterium]
MILLAILLTGCLTSHPVAEQDVSFTPASDMAMVAIGAGGRQRGPTAIRFNRLSDTGDRLDGAGLPGTGTPATQFDITGADHSAPFLVKPGRYVITRVQVVTGARTRLTVLKINGVPEVNWRAFETGSGFTLSSNEDGFTTSTWVLDLRPGRVTAVGNVLIGWDVMTKVMSVETDPPDLDELKRALAIYKNVNAPIVFETVSVYRPDRPPPTYKGF